MLDKVIQFATKAFNSGPNKIKMAHAEQTVYWVKKLKSDADEPILIAAYAHDISRAFRKTNPEETFRDKELDDPEILRNHQEESTRIIAEFLEKENYDKDSIQRVCNMIRHHEEGGDEESDLVMDADSISYLEVNAPRHTGELADKLGREKIRRKFDWMYDRISSDEAKKLAKPFYEKVLDLMG